jgi:transketolase
VTDWLVLEEKAKEIRKEILSIGSSCGKSAHFGGALSMVEILSSLFFSVMRHDPSNPAWPDRDRFVLSKGHGVLGYLATLYVAGYVDKETAYSFQQNGSSFTAHPVKNLDLGVETSSGSLGQGLPFAVGLALSFLRDGRSPRVFVVCGDGECNEGSIWESVAIACKFGLDNLTIVLDKNGFQNDGDCQGISGNPDLASCFKGFGMDVIEVNGHDLRCLVGALSKESAKGKPRVIICESIKGKGVEFMESNNDWHHNRLTERQLEMLEL